MEDVKYIDQVQMIGLYFNMYINLFKLYDSGYKRITSNRSQLSRSPPASVRKTRWLVPNRSRLCGYDENIIIFLCVLPALP